MPKKMPEHFVEQLIEGLGKIDADIAPLHAKDCTYRIYRDVRFSSDKTPYKTHMGAYLNKGGKKVPTAGYYFHMQSPAGAWWVAAYGCRCRRS